jgi:hypothetical protein
MEVDGLKRRKPRDMLYPRAFWSLLFTGDDEGGIPQQLFEV